MIHTHEDVGGGYCDCGAQRCSFRRCDSWCVHPGGWVELWELRAIRAKWELAQLMAEPPLLPGREGLLDLLTEGEK